MGTKEKAKKNAEQRKSETKKKADKEYRRSKKGRQRRSAKKESEVMKWCKCVRRRKLSARVKKRKEE